MQYLNELKNNFGAKIMTDTTKKVLKQALKLPPMDRALLIEHILSSFELPERKEIDELWANEAENRIDAYASKS